MKTYTITRNGEKIGAVYASSRLEAARVFANREHKSSAVVEEASGFRMFTWSRKAQCCQPVGQPFAVEGGR